jgi:hypothetical protein
MRAACALQLIFIWYLRSQPHVLIVRVPQQWTGRLAMMGFLTSIVEEFHTGRGTLAQVRQPQGGTSNQLTSKLRTRDQC